jgi:hypothetical protein
MAHPSVLNPTEDDIQKMLAAQVHIGTQNSDFMMSEVFTMDLMMIAS